MLPIKGPQRPNFLSFVPYSERHRILCAQSKICQSAFLSSYNERHESASEDGPHPGPKGPAKMPSRNLLRFCAMRQLHL